MFEKVERKIQRRETCLHLWNNWSKKTFQALGSRLTATNDLCERKKYSSLHIQKSFEFVRFSIVFFVEKVESG